MDVIIYQLIILLVLPSWISGEDFKADKRETMQKISQSIVQYSYTDYEDYPVIDPLFSVMMINFESGFRADIKNKRAIGLMQIMKGGVAALGYTEDQLMEPENNIKAGIYYLRKGLHKCKELKRTIGYYRYNGGPCDKWGRVEKLRYNFYNELKERVNEDNLKITLFTK